MLQWVGSLEPRVEHALGQHEVRNTGGPSGFPRDKTVILPEPVNDQRVVISGVLKQPLAQSPAVTVTSAARAEAEAHVAQRGNPRIRRTIERGDELGTASVANKSARGFSRPAAGRVQSVDDVEETQLFP